MFKYYYFLAFVLVTCRCRPDVPVTPPQAPQVLCGEIPDDIYSCVHVPTLLNRVRECKTDSLCEGMKCAFRQAGWLNNDQVDKDKMRGYFDQIAADHKEWNQAVQHLKDACLTGELPAQGYYLNCPSYDIMHCALTAFIRKSSPSQWSTSAKCSYPRQYAASCPVCPSECFAPQIPNGSCNACRQTP